MNDVVSIIVPVYNVEKYLSRCIDSILNQTYKNIEIICVNDGSTDNSLNILNTYKDKIKIINQNNQGLSVARNVGLQNSTGQYIYFCDSDDYLGKETIDKMYSFAKNNSLDLVEGRTVYKYSESEIEYSDFSENSVFNSNDEIYHFYLSTFCKTNAWNKLIKRNVLIDNRIEFIPNQISEDYEWLYLNVLKHINKSGYCHDGIYFYYQVNNNSITKKTTAKHFNSYLSIFIDLLNDEDFCYYHKKNCSPLLGNLLYILIRTVYLLSDNKLEYFRIAIKQCRNNYNIINNEKVLHYKLIMNCCKLPIHISFNYLRLLFFVYRKINR